MRAHGHANGTGGRVRGVSPQPWAAKLRPAQERAAEVRRALIATRRSV